MKILITGGTGMLGSAFKDITTDHELVLLGSGDYDLIHYNATKRMFGDIKPDACIHLAAKVGGVKANTNFMAQFCTDNLAINNNVINAAHSCGVEKVLSLLSTCVYPDSANYPLTEPQIHEGEPHFSNFGYAYAKRMLDVLSRAFRQQYNCNFITAVPNNLFGENDNFDLENSHVIPSIIRKIHEANLGGKEVVLWGDGSPLREFTYAKDLGQILLFLLDHYNGPHPINIGNINEISIKEVAQMISEILDFKGKIIWDTESPKGQHRKPSDNSRLIQLGWKKENYTDFRKALTKTCKWFIINYPNIRGIK